MRYGLFNDQLPLPVLAVTDTAETTTLEAAPPCPPPDDELATSTVEEETVTATSHDSSFSLHAVKRARTQTIPNRFFNILFYLCSPRDGE